MNWKVLCLLSGLTLVTVPAYAHTSGNVLVAQTSQQGGAMTGPSGSMKKPGAMSPSGSMKKPGAMMNGSSMKKPGATMTNSSMKKPGAMTNKGAMMHMGSRGEQVKTAQNFLKQKGLYNGPVNGVFDSKMQAAVMKFQKSKGLTPDGMIGPRTQAAMK